MHIHFPSDKRPNLMALLLVLLLALCLFSCRTKKTVVDKQEESVSLLEQNDVVTNEKEKISSSTLNFSDTKNWSITPVDSNNPSKVVYKGDTLQILNAKIEVNHSSSRENTTTNADKERSETDNSSTRYEAESSSKEKNSKVKSASWGLNLGIIVGIVVLIIVGYIHLRTK